MRCGDVTPVVSVLLTPVVPVLLTPVVSVVLTPVVSVLLTPVVSVLGISSVSAMQSYYFWCRRMNVELRVSVGCLGGVIVLLCLKLVVYAARGCFGDNNKCVSSCLQVSPGIGCMCFLVLISVVCVCSWSRERCGVGRYPGAVGRLYPE